jgi:cupin 2 domain-containing protein
LAHREDGGGGPRPDSGNLFAGLPRKLAGEQFVTLVQLPGTRIERIVSTGQTTPVGEWFDQSWDEWALLLRGGAELVIEGDAAPRRLRPGDWLLLPARTRHRVTWTDETTPTVWLAIHIGEPSSPPPAATR